jgi:hypothetical protein
MKFLLVTAATAFLFAFGTTTAVEACPGSDAAASKTKKDQNKTTAKKTKGKSKRPGKA